MKRRGYFQKKDSIKISNTFNPLVSIIIPVYNGENYVEEAIQSAIKQTYKNIEVIVVNDGSKDNTEKICLKYKDKIRYYKKENGGVASALNLGIKKMQGEYFSWLSHDDLYFEYKIEKQIDFINEHNLVNKKIILYADYELIDKDGNLADYVKINHDFYMKRPEYILLRSVINGITLLIPKTAFDECGNFNENLKCTQDYDLWNKFIKKYKFIHMNEIMTKTRIHDKQDTKNNPLVITEGNELYNHLIESVPLEKKISLEGSEYLFYRSMANCLEKTLYKKAYLDCKEKYKEIESRYQSKTNPLVSVILPFYNRISTTINAIKSVLNQTYKNIELLLINDGSTIPIDEIKKIIKNDKRIKLLEINKNSGVSSARNLGIKNSHGEYIAFLDSDDIFLPDKIKTQINLMMLSNGNISYTSYNNNNKHDYNTIYANKEGYINDDLILNNPIAISTIMIKKEFIQQKNIWFDESNMYSEDISFCLEILKTEYLLKIPDILTTINFDENSRMSNNYNKLNRTKKILNYLLTEDNYNNFNYTIANYNQKLTNMILANSNFEKLYKDSLNQCIKIEKEYNEIINSKSWKITKPVRKITEKISKIKLKIEDKIYENKIKILEVSEIDLPGKSFNGYDLINDISNNKYDVKQAVAIKYSDNKNVVQLLNNHFFHNNYNYFLDIEKKLSIHNIFSITTPLLMHSKEYQEADIIHFHLFHNAKLSLYSLLKIAQDKKVIITLHDPWFLTGRCVHFYDCNKWETGCNKCEFLNTLFPMEKDNTNELWKLKKYIFDKIDIDIVYTSKWMENLISRSEILNKCQNNHYIPFGIDLDKFIKKDSLTLREQYNISNDEIVIFLRAQEEFKGTEYVLEALKLLKTDKKITILTCERKGLLDAIKNKYRIIDLGYLKEEDVINAFNICDIFLMPSKAESFGMMAVEAMACSKPIIVFDNTVLPTITHAPECGIAVKNRDSNELQKAIKFLIDHPDERLKRGILGRKICEKEYNKKNYIKKIRKLYSDVYKRKHNITKSVIFEENDETIKVRKLLDKISKKYSIEYEKIKYSDPMVQELIYQYSNKYYQDIINKANKIN